MTKATGTEIKAAARKASLWGTAAPCGAGDGILILPPSINKKRPGIVDDSLGLYFPIDSERGAVSAEGDIPAYLRYDGLDLLLIPAGHNLAGVSVVLRHSDDDASYSPVVSDSDEFEVPTEQDIKAGGDGAKGYGWNLLNGASADAVDANVTNAGKLTVGCSTVNSGGFGAGFTVPLAFKEVSGDFDVEVHVTSNADEANEDAGLCVRDPNASAGQDHLEIFFRAASAAVYWRNTVNSLSSSGSAAASNGYFRIARAGNVFTLYSRANAGDAWTQRVQYSRDDFATTVQVGPYVATGNTNGNFVAQFDYMRFNAVGTDIFTKSWSAVTARYWKIAFENPASIPSVAELFLTSTYEWERNPSRPAGPFEEVFNVENDVTAGGQDRFLVHGDPKRQRAYHMPLCREAQKDNVKALYEAWAGAKPFWLRDHEGVWIYGKLRAPLNLRELASQSYSFDFDFLEVLP